MPQELINALINLAVAAGVSAIAAIVGAIRNRLTEKERAVFDRIIETVETVYKGSSSEEKRKAFEQLCVARKVNVSRGVKYLEDHIIPTSKNVNAFPAKVADDDDID